MHLVIFEGNHWRTFAPFSLSRPVFMLACGVGTLLDKQIRAINPTRVTLWVRPEMEAFCHREVLPKLAQRNITVELNKPLDDEPAMIISGRSLHFAAYEHNDAECVVVDEGKDGAPLVRKAWVRKPGLSPDDVLHRTARWKELLDLPRAMPQSRLPQYLWDLINWNEEAIMADSVAMRDGGNVALLPAGPYHLINEDDIILGLEVNLQPGCVLDASRGPIILGDRASIGANAVLQGPCYIGPHTQISPLALIRPGTSIGPMCKIGGEVSNSIVIGYSNKAHEGFLGDSYVGEWVNLGAGTTTSNLKNTYGEVSMTVGESCNEGGSELTIKTGRRFLGSLIGDHTKTAIGTNLMTGTYVGYNCMVGCSKHPPKFLPSLTFLTDDGPEPYDLDKAASTMKSVFNRRHRPWSTDDQEMLQYVAEAAKTVECG